MAGRAYKLQNPKHAEKKSTASMEEARRLITIIEKSQIPFGESATIYNRIKALVDAGKPLGTEDFQHLLDLVQKAQDWEKAIQSSAQTLPEETLSG